ncbi:MAG TPA: DUF1015 family protein [Nocardioidaceae bacterium]|nr:DUF1015 family protein [Nocardioidaceae bacterium]
MSIVRPFPARVVRQDWASRAVTAMPDPLDETGPDPAPTVFDPAAYDGSAAALYVYRQRGHGASHTGVVCEVTVQAFVDGQVRGHEAVDMRRVEALVRHQASTTAPPALLTLLHRPGAAFTRTLETTRRTAPILDFAGPDGLQQTVWRVPEGSGMLSVARELAAADHYIADGHHRVAAALAQWRLGGGKPADAGLLCVIHPMDDLRLSAFHRRLTGPLDPAEVVRLLTAAFQVRAVPEPPAPMPGTFGLYVGHRWFAVSHQGNHGGCRADLDVAVLQTQVLERLEQLRPRPSYPVEMAATRMSIDELTERCDADGGALFTLAPPPLEALTALADAGEVMPPKTTYFAPKPCAGIFLRPEQ